MNIELKLSHKEKGEILLSFSINNNYQEQHYEKQKLYYSRIGCKVLSEILV